MTDGAELAEIGERLTQVRVRAGLTQAELAKEAGLGKRTVERLEAGESVQLVSFLRVLRVLGLLERMEVLLPDPRPTPMQLLEQKSEERQRVYKKRVAEEAEPWRWEEES